MKSSVLTPGKVFKTAFQKAKPNISEFNRFKANLLTLLNKIKIVEQRPKDESEEHLKNDIRDFLRDTYYRDVYAINTKDKKDLVIHLSSDTNSPAGVIIEAKRPSNKGEMVSKNNLNKKALQELVLYYLRERVTHDNKQIRHLIITNINEWYIFRADQFEKLFFTKKFVAEFKDFEEKRLVGKDTNFFYTQIAKPYIERLDTVIEYTYFNFQDYDQFLRNEDKEDDKKLITLFKLLSPEHLLNLPFVNDSNSLNKEFYNELLHIMGLHEYKEGGKKLIDRNPLNARHSGSLLEDAIIQLDSLDKIGRMERPGRFGVTKEKRLFNVALELTITWINRILFLKLLEAQLKSYHKEDASYSFLNLQRIKNYDDLNSLFFQVLARKHEERNADVKKVFEKVPYLNSSLFEPSEIEHNTLLISNLRDNKLLQLYSKTVLKNGQGKRLSGTLSTLEYLFRFLDAYDFNVESDGDTKEDDKELINASVLGLIFEKINGYKDGSFYTPGFITMYMCREALRRATVQKFRNSNYFHDFDTDDFDGLINYLNRKYSLADLREANALVNSLKICDPAVGSGHFLVSALNEMLAIKSELGILCDRKGQTLRVRLEVDNDELSVKWRQTDELFRYAPGVQESQEVQEALFHEKQIIIENCLFGVDINPNSVKICRLRLWIELLKNAYYKNARELETLPNIDINIKCGNSLVSRYKLEDSLKKALKDSNWTIDSYRIAVATYRNAENKEQKREMERLIASIKAEFSSEIDTPMKKDLSEKRGKAEKYTTEILNLTRFGEKPDPKLLENHRVAAEELAKAEAKRDDILSNKIFENAFEWRFEFPEVLNDEGDFVGFDVVLGNPPYIRQEELAEFKEEFKKKFTMYTGTADIYIFFIERGFEILRNNGIFSYIMPNKFMQAGYGKPARKFLLEHNLVEIVDFGNFQIFHEATTYPCILTASKDCPSASFKTVKISAPDFLENFPAYVTKERSQIDHASLSEDTWVVSNAEDQRLLEKVVNLGSKLEDYLGEMGKYGIKTGLTEAFVIDGKKAEEFVVNNPKNEKHLHPFLLGREVKPYAAGKPSNYLIKFEKGFSRKSGTENPQKWFEEEFSDIFNHFQEYREKAKKRTDKGDFYWELRSCDYYDLFEKPKIMYQVLQVRPCFVYDDTGLYCNNSMWIIPSNDKVLLGRLNSNMGWWLISKYCTAIQNGYQLIWKYFSQIPIATGNEAIKEEISSLVEEILNAKKPNPGADTTELEAEINQLVYKLYELTDEEIAMIEDVGKS